MAPKYGRCLSHFRHKALARRIQTLIYQPAKAGLVQSLPRIYSPQPANPFMTMTLKRFLLPLLLTATALIGIAAGTQIEVMEHQRQLAELEQQAASQMAAAEARHDDALLALEARNLAMYWNGYFANCRQVGYSLNVCVSMTNTAQRQGRP